MTEKAAPDEGHADPTLKELATSSGTHNVQPPNEIQDPTEEEAAEKPKLQKPKSLVSLNYFNCSVH